MPHMLTLFRTSQTPTAKCKTAALTATFFAICFADVFQLCLWLVLFQIYGVVLFQIYGVVLFQIYGVDLFEINVALFHIYGGFVLNLRCSFASNLWCSFVSDLWCSFASDFGAGVVLLPIYSIVLLPIYGVVSFQSWHKTKQTKKHQITSWKISWSKLLLVKNDTIRIIQNTATGSACGIPILQLFVFNKWNQSLWHDSIPENTLL